MENSSAGYRGKFVRVKTAKNRSNASSRWLQRHLNDQYVIKARQDGYRSRAAYKLLEIHNKFHIFKKGYNVVDLGAAPGGWSQIAVNLIGSDKADATCKVVALDLLPMDPMAGAITLQQDFFLPEAQSRILEVLGGTLADVVMSDMAANTIGHSKTDHLRIMALCESSFDFALTILKPGGHFIAKIFRGGAEGSLLNIAKQKFKTVKHFKPDSSRKESSEFYLIALDRKADTDLYAISR
jgi:23S rRNA (uridine2552-2'-O)-methyltransferase